MKNPTQFYSLFILFSLITLSCNHITKSIDETFHPNDSLVKKYNKENHFDSNGEYTASTKTSIASAVQRHQEKTIVINGDTINTPEMELKAKEMFHDIELLKQQKHPAAAKKIQKRVDEFLKEMKLPQGGLKNTKAAKPVVKAKKALLSIPDLALAQEQLKRLPQYQSKEIMVYQSVHFYGDGSINLMLQHPVNPKYVDAYKYQDEVWSAPKPVLATDIERKTFPLSKMHFEDARKVLKIYNEKATQVEGAKPATSVYISIWDENMRWFPQSINGNRERFDIQFNNDGTLKSFRKE